MLKLHKKIKKNISIYYVLKKEKRYTNIQVTGNEEMR